MSCLEKFSLRNLINENNVQYLNIVRDDLEKKLIAQLAKKTKYLNNRGVRGLDLSAESQIPRHRISRFYEGNVIALRVSFH